MTNSNNPLIICFSGLKGSGKTYAVDTIVDLLADHGVAPVKLSFASRIREMVIAIFGEKIKPYLYESTMKETPIPWLYGTTARKILQIFGTEFIREAVSPNYWVDIIAENFQYGSGVFLIDDCRFQNEAEMLRSYGAVMIRLTSSDTTQSDHPSEQLFDMLEGEALIHNTKDEEFLEEINTLFNKHILPRL